MPFHLSLERTRFFSFSSLEAARNKSIMTTTTRLLERFLRVATFDHRKMGVPHDTTFTKRLEIPARIRHLFIYFSASFSMHRRSFERRRGLQKGLKKEGGYGKMEDGKVRKKKTPMRGEEGRERETRIMPMYNRLAGLSEAKKRQTGRSDTMGSKTSNERVYCAVCPIPIHRPRSR